MTKVIALILFGTVAWVVSMFYFVNWPDPEVQFATWCTLSQMISIFTAVLIFGASTGTLIDFAGLEVHHTGTPDNWTLFVGFARWIVAYGILQTAFLVLQKENSGLVCFASVAAHAVGFCAIDAFGVSLHLPIFSASLLRSCLGVMLSCTVLGTVSLVTHKMRDMIAKRETWGEDSKEEWLEHCAEADTESLGLSCGLLMSLLIRYAITGSLPMVHGNPRYKTDQQVWALFVVSICLAPVVVGSAVLQQTLKESDRFMSFLEDKGLKDLVLYLVDLFKETCIMTAGWCTLYWGYWCYYVLMEDEHGAGGMIGMRIVLAILFSGLVLASIIGIDFIADRTRHAKLEKGLRSLVKMMALLMGLSWESTFAIGVEAFASEVHSRYHTLAINLVVLGMCALVLPAWAMYIVPHTQETQGLRTHAEHEQAQHKEGA